ncbi:MAG: helix-hairpin-helix domain-containing protein [Gammaproteobacteria bacterium]|nr:helix-hairpin-helix domain-containing protein [Gammaproteobacteria bacterium]MDP2140899.1 helix-hairpin-helix domain-containing protein [Gammaproteobacteria bacterium]MDP2349357.1 helix-hairpin-helix domain-containing protein [Gammaproteobacteria bacterium]
MPLHAQTAEAKPAEVSEAKNKVDINTADAATLALALDGIGMVKAQEIVAYREEHGEFKSIEQLTEVKGIGAATIARNRDKIIVATTSQ